LHKDRLRLQKNGALAEIEPRKDRDSDRREQRCGNVANRLEGNAVGSAVGQIARIKGCRAIGIAGKLTPL